MRSWHAMSDVLTAPYGAWRSPITSDVIVATTIGLTDVLLDVDDVYWIEARPRGGWTECGHAP